jgi:NAD(P)-dependent dehydrogenase (short-subunit alcohol dehydrogenase family)
MPGTAIITGASRGIGRAIAHRLSKDGFRVALNDLPSSKDALEGVKSEILESGGQAGVYHANVSNEDDVQTMVADVARTMGGIDVVGHVTVRVLEGVALLSMLHSNRWSPMLDSA